MKIFLKILLVNAVFLPAALFLLYVGLRCSTDFSAEFTAPDGETVIRIDGIRIREFKIAGPELYRAKITLSRNGNTVTKFFKNVMTCGYPTEVSSFVKVEWKDSHADLFFVNNCLSDECSNRLRVHNIADRIVLDYDGNADFTDAHSVYPDGNYPKFSYYTFKKEEPCFCDYSDLWFVFFGKN